jgi:hypothetical protein
MHRYRPTSTDQFTDRIASTKKSENNIDLRHQTLEQRVTHLLCNLHRCGVLQLEDAFDDRQLCTRRFHPCECRPVVHHHPTTNHWATTVDSTSLHHVEVSTSPSMHGSTRTRNTNTGLSSPQSALAAATRARPDPQWVLLGAQVRPYC